MIGPGSSFGQRLRWLRLAKGLKQAELARLIGRHPTAIGPYERDEYTPPPAVLERLARALDTSAEYLLFGRHPQRSTIPLSGRIGPGGLGRPGEFGPLALRDDRLEGWRIEDETMAPAFAPGQIALVARLESPPAELLGRVVLARLADGRHLLRRLLPARRADRFDLFAWNAPALSAVEVVSVKAVLGALWPEAFRGSAGEDEHSSAG
ncbi:MAG: helix-turn-helix transcriptional regulator [Geminicoccaceae bacterium]|nr:helix-turn-helix domain-containing protein [Geminicoccaceae bacterium]MDW8341465.1 helix-turn-helix transcriptional regulator [Geminicoccaceae bacterium]